MRPVPGPRGTRSEVGETSPSRGKQWRTHHWLRSTRNGPLRRSGEPFHTVSLRRCGHRLQTASYPATVAANTSEARSDPSRPNLGPLAGVTPPPGRRPASERPPGCLGNRGTVRSGPIATQWPRPETRHVRARRAGGRGPATGSRRSSPRPGRIAGGEAHAMVMLLRHDLDRSAWISGSTGRDAPRGRPRRPST
jgi:hypothetical protein